MIDRFDNNSILSNILSRTGRERGACEWTNAIGKFRSELRSKSKATSLPLRYAHTEIRCHFVVEPSIKFDALFRARLRIPLWIWLRVIVTARIRTPGLWRTSFPIVLVIVLVLVLDPQIFYRKHPWLPSFTSVLPPRPALDRQRSKLDNDNEHEHD
jgi:hypothetical protein